MSGRFLCSRIASEQKKSIETPPIPNVLQYSIPLFYPSARMNRDTTIIQIAVLMVAIGVLGIAIYRQQTGSNLKEDVVSKNTIVQEKSWKDDLNKPKEIAPIKKIEDPSTDKVIPKNVEKENSPLTNLVKQYFAHLQGREYKEACTLMSTSKCVSTKASAVESFSQEHLKYVNGYEYISVKDFDIQSPSWKDIVCVKYAYRYKGDTKPWLISEVMSFYIEEDVGKYLIADRVCEKKYKEGAGVRPCPIEARQNFCIGKIK